MLRAPFRRFAILLSLVSLVALPAVADWEQAYREGVRAFEKRNYAVAASFMQQALGERPQASSDTVNINGGFNVAYTPSQYLAAALANNGDCDGAQEAVRNAQGTAAGGDALLKGAKRKCPSLDLNPGPSLAEQQRAKAEQDARARLEAKQKADADAATLKAANDAKAKADREAKLKSDQDAATRARAEQEARQKTERDTAARAALEAKQKADQAQAAKAQEAAQKLAASRQNLETRIGEAKAILEVTPTADPAARNALSKVVASSGIAALTNSDTDMTNSEKSLAAAIAKFRATPLPGGGDDGTTILRMVVQLYVTGKYTAIPSILKGQTITSNAIKAQIALFRAAAAYADAIIARDKNPQAKIAEDLKEYHRLRGGTPDARLFSPAFRALVTAQ